MDPHRKEYEHIPFIADPKHREFWDKMAKENDEAYEALKDKGLEFRGWRYGPPFFCMVCGYPISTNQWLFSRICGECDTAIGAQVRMRMQVTFAGQCELIQEEEGHSRPTTRVDPRTPEGASLAEQAQSLKSALRKQRFTPPIPERSLPPKFRR